MATAFNVDSQVKFIRDDGTTTFYSKYNSSGDVWLEIRVEDGELNLYQDGSVVETFCLCCSDSISNLSAVSLQDMATIINGWIYDGGLPADAVTGSGTDTYLVRWDGTTGLEDADWAVTDAGNMYPVTAGNTFGTSSKPVGDINTQGDLVITDNSQVGTVTTETLTGTRTWTLADYTGEVVAAKSVNNNGVVYMDSSGEGTTAAAFNYDGTNLQIEGNYEILNSAGEGTYVGSITSETLTAARTWTAPNYTGEFVLAKSVNNNGVVYLDSSGEGTTVSTFNFDGTNLQIAGDLEIVDGGYTNIITTAAVTAARTWTFADYTGEVATPKSVNANGVVYYDVNSEATTNTGFNYDGTNLQVDGNFELFNSTYIGSIATATLTAARTWTFPDATGTVALVGVNVGWDDVLGVDNTSNGNNVVVSAGDTFVITDHDTNGVAYDNGTSLVTNSGFTFDGDKLVVTDTQAGGGSERNSIEGAIAVNSGTQSVASAGVEGKNSLTSSASHSGTGTSALAGVRGDVVHSSSGTLSEANGTVGVVTTSGSAGTITSAYGAVGSVANVGTGTITDASALFASGGTNSGTITTYYGLQVEDITQGTTNYAILTNAGDVTINNGNSANADFTIKGQTDSSLFFLDASQDNIGIGTGTPDTNYILDVQGDAFFSNELRANTTSTTYQFEFGVDTNQQFSFVRGGTSAASASNLLLNLWNNGNTPELRFFNGGSVWHNIPARAASSVVFNDAGADMDFRIEGDTAVHLFFLDGSADVIGINNSSPNSSYVLDVSGDIGLTGDIYIGTNDTEIISDSGGVVTYHDGMPADGIWWRVNDQSGLTAISLNQDGTILMGRPLFDDVEIDGTTGYVGINTAPSTLLHVGTEDPANEYIQVQAAVAGANPAGIVLYKHRGTIASPSATNSGDNIGTVSIHSYGSAQSEVANMYGVATEAHGGSALGTKLAFSITADGATSVSTALTIDQDKSLITEGRVVNATITTFADADTTPSVSTSNVFKEANTGSTTITNFDDGSAGQMITIIFTTANTTLSDSGNLKLAGGLTGSADDTITLVYDGTNWFEVSRSVN
jgi:hypothetical protein